MLKYKHLQFLQPRHDDTSTVSYRYRYTVNLVSMAADEAYQDLLTTEDPAASPPRFDAADSSSTVNSSPSQDYLPPGASNSAVSPRRRGSSIIPSADANGVIFNLMNAVIGVGVLAMPYTFKRAGLLIAPVLLLIVGGLTERSLCLMVRAGDLIREGNDEANKGTSTSSSLAIGYSATVGHLFGPFMGTMSDVFIVTMNFGSAVAYLDVIADILAAWVGQNSKVVALLLVVLFVVGPLSCVRAIEKLKFTSLLGLAIYALFGLITIALFFIGVSCGGEAHVPLASSNLLVAVPIQTLAFACHTVVFPVYREFRETPGSDSATFQKALQKTVGLCMTMYVLVGFFGALTFRDNTLGDILKNYSGEGGGFAHFIEAIFAFSICMTYPLLVFPMRDSLDILLMKMNCVSDLPRNRGWSSGEFDKIRFYVLTVILISFAFTIAVLIPDVEVVFGLTGCTMGILICFVLPSTMFLKASSANSELGLFQVGDGEHSKDRQTALIVLVVGSVLGFASFIMTLVSLGQNVEESGGHGGPCNSTNITI